MIDDHSSLGIDPERNYALYQHTLDEAAYLVEVLGAKPDELASFRKSVTEAETMS